MHVARVCIIRTTQPQLLGSDTAIIGGLCIFLVIRKIQDLKTIIVDCHPTEWWSLVEALRG